MWSIESKTYNRVPNRQLGIRYYQTCCVSYAHERNEQACHSPEFFEQIFVLGPTTCAGLHF